MKHERVSEENVPHLFAKAAIKIFYGYSAQGLS